MLRPFLPPKRPISHIEGGWVCLRAGLNIIENLINLLNSRSVQPVTSLCINYIKSPDRSVRIKSVSTTSNTRTIQSVSSLCINYYIHQIPGPFSP